MRRHLTCHTEPSNIANESVYNCRQFVDKSFTQIANRYIPGCVPCAQPYAYRLREAGVTESVARDLARQPAPVPEDPDRAFDAPESA